MSSFLIEGGHPLEGTYTPSGNKNEALPALMACILTDEPVTLTRVPRIQDILTTIELLRGIGVEAEWSGEDTLTLCARSVNSFEPDPKLCERIRASILLIGPLLSRFGQIKLPPPGGDIIGARRMDTHFEGVEALGGKLFFGSPIVGYLEKLKPTDVFLDEPSVTATENLLLLAARSDGTTVLHNAACEPHVVGLCQLLTAMGAKISGVGTNRIEIEGVSQLHGCTHEIGPDFMEIGSLMCLGSITPGEIRIDRVKPADLRFICKTLGRLGINPQWGDDQSLVITAEDSISLKMSSDISGRVASIYSAPWPAFPTDLMSVAIVAATQSAGTMIFHEKMFEGRMFFTDKLMEMGANIVLCDPHRVVVNGPTSLRASRMSSPDVRAGMALLTAALVAKGTSEINNVYQIERGYYALEKKLGALGAKIKVLQD